MVGLSLATGAALGYGLPKAWRSFQPRSVLLRAEEALIEYARPSQLAEVTPATAALPANTYFGSYRPPPPPRPAPLGVTRGGIPRPPNPGWGKGRVHAPIYPRPTPRVVGMMAQQRNEGEDTDAGEGRFEGQDIRHLRILFERELRVAERRVLGRVSPQDYIYDLANGSWTR